MKAIAFDLGDTLVEYEGVPLSWEDHYPDALASLAAVVSASIGPQQIDAGAAILRSYNTRLYPRTAEVPFETILSEILGCFELKGGAGDTLSCARAFFGIFQQRLRCFPDALLALQAARNCGLRIGIFTDVPYGMPAALVHEDIRNAGLYESIDVIATSVEAGFRKSDPQTLSILA